MEREELVALVRRIMAAEGDDALMDAWIEALRGNVVDPHVVGYIFHPEDGWAPTAEEIVERALAYRPFAL